MKNFRFFISFLSPFKLPFSSSSSSSTTSSSSLSSLPEPRDRESIPKQNSNHYLSSSLSPTFPTPKLVDIPQLVASFWSLFPFQSNTQSRRLPQNPTSTDLDLSRPLFRPYVAKVPWHGGVRAFLSQLFPRYGHYCGPNWSSGKDGGSLLWDRRPIDWLDFCCYCHDIGYDTHDQAKLLKADLAFLQCLEQPRMVTKGDARAAHLYRTMCIAGLRNVLIPYRMQLVRLQGGPSIVELMSSLIGKSPTTTGFKQDQR